MFCSLMEGQAMEDESFEHVTTRKYVAWADVACSS